MTCARTRFLPKIIWKIQFQLSEFMLLFTLISHSRVCDGKRMRMAMYNVHTANLDTSLYAYRDRCSVLPSSGNPVKLTMHSKQEKSRIPKYWLSFLASHLLFSKWPFSVSRKSFEKLFIFVSPLSLYVFFALMWIQRWMKHIQPHMYTFGLIDLSGMARVNNRNRNQHTKTASRIFSAKHFKLKWWKNGRKITRKM